MFFWSSCSCRIFKWLNVTFAGSLQLNVTQSLNTVISHDSLQSAKSRCLQGDRLWRNLFSHKMMKTFSPEGRIRRCNVDEVSCLSLSGLQSCTTEQQHFSFTKFAMTALGSNQARSAVAFWLPRATQEKLDKCQSDLKSLNLLKYNWTTSGEETSIVN